MEETTNNTTEKIIAAIDRKKVTPRPKWYFALRDTALWIPGIITTLLGAYTVAGVLYGLLHAHWENRLYVQYSGPLVFIAVIPLLWVISFVLFLFITLALLRKTNNGYRHTAMQLLLVSLTSSIVIGMLFYAVTASSVDGVETYYRHPTEQEQEHIWNNPDQGRISGIVTAISNNTIQISGFDGSVWNVTLDTVSTAKDQILLHEGDAVRIVGIENTDDTFTACRILPWEFFPEISPSNTALQPARLPARPSSCGELLHNLSGR